MTGLYGIYTSTKLQLPSPHMTLATVSD